MCCVLNKIPPKMKKKAFTSISILRSSFFLEEKYKNNGKTPNKITF